MDEAAGAEFEEAFPGMFLVAYRVTYRALGDVTRAEDAAAEALARALVSWRRVGRMEHRDGWWPGSPATSLSTRSAGPAGGERYQRPGCSPPPTTSTTGLGTTTVAAETTTTSTAPAETTTTSGVPATAPSTTRAAPPTTAAAPTTTAAPATTTTIAETRVACEASEVVVTATPDRTSYAPGSRVTVTAAALNQGLRVCFTHDPSLEI